jgi:hypothetical protein
MNWQVKQGQLQQYGGVSSQLRHFIDEYEGKRQDE